MNSSESTINPFELLKQYKYLRVADVCDGMDGVGHFDTGLMSPEVRPLWHGMKFWGVAFTLRCVPANRPMWKLNTTEEVVRAHGVWFNEVGKRQLSRSDPDGTRHRNGYRWCAGKSVFGGSANSLNMIASGAVGIITDGYCRDTDELILQQDPNLFPCTWAHNYSRPYSSGRSPNPHRLWRGYRSVPATSSVVMATAWSLCQSNLLNRLRCMRGRCC